jgi:hypothetical protein
MRDAARGLLDSPRGDGQDATEAWVGKEIAFIFG